MDYLSIILAFVAGMLALQGVFDLFMAMKGGSGD